MTVAGGSIARFDEPVRCEDWEDAEAVAKRLAAIDTRTAHLVTSESLAFELTQSPYPDRLPQM